jgi:hypothetical protein
LGEPNESGRFGSVPIFADLKEDSAKKTQAGNKSEPHVDAPQSIPREIMSDAAVDSRTRSAGVPKHINTTTPSGEGAQQTSASTPIAENNVSGPASANQNGESLGQAMSLDEMHSSWNLPIRTDLESDWVNPTKAVIDLDPLRPIFADLKKDSAKKTQAGNKSEPHVDAPPREIMSDAAVDRTRSAGAPKHINITTPSGERVPSSKHLLVL